MFSLNNNLVLKILILKAFMILTSKQNMFEQHFDKLYLYCESLANLSDKSRATLR